MKSDLKMGPILDELEAAAGKLGLRVSFEVLDSVGGGGLCKVKGTYRVIIEKRGTTGEKVVTLARALAAVGGTEGIFLGPAARDVVERFLPAAVAETATVAGTVAVTETVTVTVAGTVTVAETGE